MGGQPRHSKVEKQSSRKKSHQSAPMPDIQLESQRLSPHRKSFRQKLSDLADSNLFWSGGVAMALAAYAFEWGKAPPALCVVLLIDACVIITVAVYRHNFFEGKSRGVRTVSHILVSGCLAVVLILAWIALRLDAAHINTPMNAIEVYPPFLDAYKNYKRELGDPILAVQSNRLLSYQAAHEHALVIWAQLIHGFYKLPNDPKKPWQFENQPTWPEHGFANLKQRIATFNPPKGKTPPYAGVAASWLADPKQWDWIGWMDFFCSFPPNATFYQKFERGIVIGPFSVREAKAPIPLGLMLVILDDKTWHGIDFDGPIPHCEPANDG